MNDNKSGSIVKVTIAIIGLIGILGAAYITGRLTQTQKFHLKAEMAEHSDGFTSVRSLADKNGQELDRVHDGEVFFTHYQDDNWWHIKTKRGKVGFMHISRIKFLE